MTLLSHKCVSVHRNPNSIRYCGRCGKRFEPRSDCPGECPGGPVKCRDVSRGKHMWQGSRFTTCSITNPLAFLWDSSKGEYGYYRMLCDASKPGRARTIVDGREMSAQPEFKEEEFDAMDDETRFATLARMYNNAPEQVQLRCFGTHKGVCDVGSVSHTTAVDDITAMCMARKSDSIEITLSKVRDFSEDVDLPKREVSCENIAEIRSTLFDVLSQMHTFFQTAAEYTEYVKRHKPSRDGGGFKYISLRFKRRSKNQSKIARAPRLWDVATVLSPNYNGHELDRWDEEPQLYKKLPNFLRTHAKYLTGDVLHVGTSYGSRPAYGFVCVDRRRKKLWISDSETIYNSQYEGWESFKTWYVQKFPKLDPTQLVHELERFLDER